MADILDTTAVQSPTAGRDGMHEDLDTIALNAPSQMTQLLANAAELQGRDYTQTHIDASEEQAVTDAVAEYANYCRKVSLELCDSCNATPDVRLLVPELVYALINSMIPWRVLVNNTAFATLGANDDAHEDAQDARLTALENA